MTNERAKQKMNQIKKSLKGLYSETNVDTKKIKEKASEEKRVIENMLKKHE